MIPVFAVLGHPNEGKSSVVSTLSEDDSIRISPIPGETRVCRDIPVMVDGKEIIRFVDTPGFQHPKSTLSWMREYEGRDDQIVKTFRDTHKNDPVYQDEVELFSPVEKGAGIIYVADGSRPLRSNDRAEMEILRLTGKPRMAILNPKDRDTGYIETWKAEFRKHFNSIRVFNAHRATYAERIDLLHALKSVDQDWQPAIASVISAFEKDWHRRNMETASRIYEMLLQCLQLQVVKNYTENTNEETAREKALQEYRKEIENIEKKAHSCIRKLYKHNIFNYELPGHSIVKEDLFSSRTWQVLGISKKQLAAAAGVAGGAVGAALDIAAHGLTFGVFTALGGIIGAGSALMNVEKLASAKIVGLPMGGYQTRVGPCENVQLLYVLLDRALIYYSHIINWAHGRRESTKKLKDPPAPGLTLIGYAGGWDEKTRKIFTRFFKALRKEGQNYPLQKEVEDTLVDILYSISKTDKQPDA